ncbi:MAG: carboxymuconolactone decarboxylase family protein [Immundisolibacterales bacterium]|nr:carboxymuconolactone decarboxylase family protein [Immundisolibacterales bacterium]
MARVRDVEIHEVPADLRPVYRRFAESYGPFLNQVKVFAHRAPALRHLMGMLLELADEAILPKRYLEIALVAVSKVNECTYCVAHHGPRLVEQGLDPASVAAILEPEVPGFDDVDTLVRDYAVAVTDDPRRMPGSMVERLSAHFTEEQIVELTLRATLCGFFNRFNEALGIEIEEGVVEDLLGSGMRLDDLPHPETLAAGGG